MNVTAEPKAIATSHEQVADDDLWPVFTDEHQTLLVIVRLQHSPLVFCEPPSERLTKLLLFVDYQYGFRASHRLNTFVETSRLQASALWTAWPALLLFGLVVVPICLTKRLRRQ
jgi:hypothetical protein